MRYVSLRYFNAAGATTRRGERHDPETHLIPLILRAAQDARYPITVFGNDYPTRDGTCVRDYVHVSDLARAHVLALEALTRGDISAQVFNLGCGDGYTVREVIDAAKKITGRDIPVNLGRDAPAIPQCSWRVRIEPRGRLAGGRRRVHSKRLSGRRGSGRPRFPNSLHSNLTAARPST